MEEQAPRTAAPYHPAAAPQAWSRRSSAWAGSGRDTPGAGNLSTSLSEGPGGGNSLESPRFRVKMTMHLSSTNVHKPQILLLAKK